MGSSWAPRALRQAAESNPAQLLATAGESELTKPILSCLGGGILNFKRWQQNQSRLPMLLTILFSYQEAERNAPWSLETTVALREVTKSKH